MRTRLPLPLIAATVGVASLALAAWLFPRALPIVALEQSMTRDAALARADSFFRDHALVRPNARRAVHFGRNDSLRTFIELSGGRSGHDSLSALVRGRDVAPFTWSVRAFIPGDPREAHVDFAPDGRIIGFERILSDTDTLPAVSVDSARRLAHLALHHWVDSGADSARWTLVTTSMETVKGSGRIDRTFTFERNDLRVSGAPVRSAVVVAGNTPAAVGPFVEIPQAFERRYAEMRSWNEILALVASLGILAVAILGLVALGRFARAGTVRWRPPFLIGGVIGILTLAAALNEIPGSWIAYDTAMSPMTFQITQLISALVFAATTGLVTAFTLAAAEVATRHAFPRQLDWWKLWRYRGTKEVAGAVGGGYAVAAVAFAYVALFYVVTRTLFGWWVPSELLDDPNLIASPMPWLSGLALSLNAGVWEEALFRALPLALLALWVGDRPNRRWWMAAGVVTTALVFGFAHANYESWPPYSRGVEIFLDACFWAVLFLRFGLLLTVTAHFLYDAVLFGIFAASGNAPAYRVTAAIIFVALAAPALIVLWQRARHGRFVEAPDDARFGAWVPSAEEPVSVAIAQRPASAALSVWARRLALAALALGVVVAVGRPSTATLGAAFTVRRDRIHATADSVLRAHGGDPARWKRFSTIGNDTLPGWSRFLQLHQLRGEAQRFATTFVPATWWVVRYVHTSGSAADRIEEWRVRLWPDGRPLDIRHLIPDSLRRDTADAAALRRIALGALARGGIDTLVLRETDVTETARPARRDVTVTYTDTSVKLPDGAAARAWVQIAGDEPLVARRGVELPETFLRAERGRETNRLMIFGIAMLVLVAFVVIGALLVRRHPPVVDDDGLLGGRKPVVLAILAIMVLSSLGQLNALPSQLYSYDTSQPWNTFVGTTALQFITTIVIALVLVGLSRALDALRRRVGIPLHAEDPDHRRRDMLLAGCGIAGTVYAVSGLLSILRRGGMPATPDTVLDLAVPAVAGVAETPVDALVAVLTLGIPILVVAGLSRRWLVRAVLAGMMLAVAGVAAWATGPSGDGAGIAVVALSLLGVAVIAAALVTWGSRSAWSWVVAALAFGALGALRDAVHGIVWEERVAGLLVVAVAATLIWAIVRGGTGESRVSAAHAAAA